MLRALFLSLLLVSLTARAESFVMSQGDTTVSLQQTAVGAAAVGAGAYALNRSGNARFFGSHGEMSNKTMSAGVKQTVPKSTVFKNLLNNAKKGKIAGGWWGVASAVVTGYLANKGYLWMQEQQEWVKKTPKGMIACFSASPAGPCVSKFRYPVPFVYSQEPALLGDECKRVGDLTGKGVTDIRYNANTQGSCFGKLESSSTGFAESAWISRAMVSEGEDVLTQSEFDAIIEPEADKDPLPFIDATRPERDKPVPGLSPGTIVVGGDDVLVTDPYKVGDKAYQTEWKITRAADGSATITRTVTRRADLEKAGTIGAVPTAKPEDKPKDTPTSATQTATGGGSATPPVEIPDTCKLNPDSLGCVKVGEGEVPELKLPSSDNNFSWSPTQFLPNSAACPADKTFKVAGHSFAISYGNICRFLDMIRPVVIAACMIIAAVMIFNFLRAK